MFITIRNLPLHVKTKDISKLITEKCLIADVILGPITREEGSPTRKVTIGLADECDAAIVFRKLNGFHLNGYPLILEDPRKNKGPVPGELPQVMNTMPYQATAMHMQSQQIMIPAYNAMAMTSTGFYNPTDPMMQLGVLDQGFGFVQQPMIMTNEETMLHHNRINQQEHQMQPRPQTNQPRHQMNQPRQQIKQPRHQFNQLRPQINQPRPQLNQPRPQINQPRPQINQPRPQINQPRHQMIQPIKQQSSRNNEPARHRPESHRRMHQQESRRPPYEESRNDYRNPNNREPHQNSAVNQTALDWDIPSREVVFQESDPVWGVRVKKHSDMAPNDFQLENRRTTSWNEPGLANQIDDNNFEQFTINRQAYDVDEDGYRYHEPSTRTIAYQPHNDDSFITDNYPRNENPEYNSDAMPFNRPNNPVWEPHKQNDNFEINNRKRTYSKIQRDNYEYSDADPGFEGQDDRSKRNKRDNYQNSFTSNDMEVRHHEPAMDSVFEHSYNESEIDNEFEEVATDGRPFLGFKKFKFSYQLQIAKFKEFERYMFKNLISKRFTTNVKAYNVMYAVCRLIMKKLTIHLGFRFRKYAYFVLNYIQLLIEKALGERMRNPKTWKHKCLFDAFHQNYTYPEFFVMFKKWFEYYDDKCDIQVTPKIAAMLNEAQMTMTKTRPNLIPETPRKPGSKPVNEGKPGSRSIKAQGRPEVWPPAKKHPSANPNAQGKPGAPAFTQAKPNIKKKAQGKPNLKAMAANLKQKGKAQATLKIIGNAQGKPNAPGQKKKNPSQETDPEEIKAMELVKRKADTILSIPVDVIHKLVQELRQQFDPELERALRIEMEGVNQAVTCISEKITPANLSRRYSAILQRSIIYRLLNLHIALTAKITFAPDEKQPSLAACNEFFNARQGRVLHLEQNLAMVLFSSNETIKKMCDEKDVEIEGCKIQNIVPLDFELNTDEFHYAIEDAIKTDHSEKIRELVFNKSYIKGRVRNDDVLITSDDDEQEDKPISEAELVKSEPNFDNATAKPNPNSAEIDIAKAKVVGDDVNNKQPESEENAVHNSNKQTQEKLKTQTEPTPKTQIEKTLNIKTEEISKIKTETVVTSNTLADEIQNIQCVQESSNDVLPGLPSPIDSAVDEDRDEKIKEFLEDFEKAINENEEIFMSEDDLEDFEL